MLNSSRPTQQNVSRVKRKKTHFTQKFQSNTKKVTSPKISKHKDKTKQKQHFAFDFNVIRILKYDFK